MNCWTGEKGVDIESVNPIRQKYITKHGSLKAFKEKIRLDREKFITNVNLRSNMHNLTSQPPSSST